MKPKAKKPFKSQAKGKPVIRTGQKKPFQKTTKENLDKRIDEVEKLVSNRVRKSEIHRIIKKKYNIEWRQTDLYIARARELFLDRLRQTKETHRSQSFALYEQVMQEGNPREKILAQERIDKLLGLEQPRSLNISGVEGGAPIKIQSTKKFDASKLSVERLIQLKTILQDAKAEEKKKAIRQLETPVELEEFSEAEIDRLLAEKSFHEFVKQAWHIIEPSQEFCDNWHIEGICIHLEAVTLGKITQLLINVPPGTMKSLLTNVFWPAWIWTTHPEKRFMFSSYAEDLSMRDSVKCRTLVLSMWYQTRWPLDLCQDQNTKGKFQNEKGGWRMVGSISGKGIGEHPDFMACDDPHNVRTAESEQERQNVIDWLDGTFSTRGVSRRVKKVVIMQRLHFQDASGHLLSKGGWEHLCLPMRYEEPALTLQPDGSQKLVPRMKPTCIGWNDPRKKDGELLWPKLYPDDVVQTLEINLGIYHAAGQLQQRPAPRGGGKFKRVWFTIVKTIPAMDKIVRYWDKAGTASGHGAQTAGTLMGTWRDNTVTIEAMRKKYIALDVITFREAAAGREALIKQTAAADRAKWGHVETWVEQEPGSGGKESAEGTVANLAGFVCKIERVTGSKDVRADPLASQASVGKVQFLEGEWNQTALDELEHFPVGKLKDVPDSMSGAFNKLNNPSEAFGSVSDMMAGEDHSLPRQGEIETGGNELNLDDLDLG